MWLLVFALVSLVLANAGLERMISISAPVLEVIYPVAVTLMALTFMPKERAKGYTHKLAAAAATLSSLVSTVTGMKFLWLIPTVIFTLAGLILDSRSGKGWSQRQK